MQTKFKKGDRVVAVKDCAIGFYNEGDECVIDFMGIGEAVILIDERYFGINIEKLQSDFRLKGEVQHEAIQQPEVAPRLASDMTIREHYAGLALQGMLAADDKSLVYDLLAKTNKSIYYCYAKLATEQADALINALNKKL